MSRFTPLVAALAFLALGYLRLWYPETLPASQAIADALDVVKKQNPKTLDFQMIELTQLRGTCSDSI